jgi:hypothetical protein
MDLCGTSTRKFRGVIRQKHTDTGIKGSGVLTFLSVSTGYGNIFKIRSLTVLSVTNADKDMNQPFYMTHDCCQMTADALLLGEIQIESPKKNPVPRWGFALSRL